MKTAVWIFAAVLASWQVHAQEFPTRVVRIVVPFPAGLAADTVARTLAHDLTAQWGQPVIIENRPGGSTIIATEVVVRAQPDGYTLLLTSDDTFTINPHLFPKLPFDPMKDLVPVHLPALIPMVIVANASGVDSLPGFIAHVRANPGKLSYGSYGTGSSAHLAMETLKSLAGLDIVHVPYKGVALSVAALVAGDVQVVISGYSTASAMIKAGRLKPLAVASPERMAELPNVPTTRELGYSDVDATVWWTVSAPARTPVDTVNRISDSISRALKNPETRKSLEGRGNVVLDIGPKPFAEQLARQHKFQAEAVRRSGAKLD
jgi:tripartite-type tricarboxylate transporter receptor subunit TctC